MNNNLFAIDAILKTQLWVLLKIYTLVKLNNFKSTYTTINLELSQNGIQFKPRSMKNKIKLLILKIALVDLDFRQQKNCFMKAD